MAKRYVLGPTAARKLTELLRGSGEVSRRSGATAAVAFDSEYVAPFTVQWAQSASGGSGAWLVWLPSDKCLIVDGAAVDLTADIEAAEAPYPAGWYVLKDIPESGGSVFLNITPGDPEASKREDQVASAKFSASASETKGNISVLLASVAKNSSTGAVTVKQTITSALVFGTGKGDAETTPLPTPFMVGTYERDAGQGEKGDEHGKVTVNGIVNGVFYWDGELKTVDSIDVPSGKATVYLNCTGTKSAGSADGYSWTCSLGTSPVSPDNSDTLCRNFKLYDFDNGAVTMDYRDTFLALASGTDEKIKPDGVSLDFVTESEGQDGEDRNLEIKGFKAAAVGKVPYKSGSGIVWDGKTIKSVDVSASETEQIITFKYSDDTTTEIHIPHGIAGEKGEDGEDGETPELTGVKNGDITQIFANGEMIAEIKDGHTPSITADENDGVLTIYADGAAIAQIQVGEGNLPDKDVITDVSFSISDGKLIATLDKENLKTGASSQDTKTVCEVAELDVVTEEAYSTSTHQFTNTRKKIKVIGTPADATGQTPFTATPLSEE
jgi:hypothetical protein